MPPYAAFIKRTGDGYWPDMASKARIDVIMAPRCLIHIKAFTSNAILCGKPLGE